MTCLSLLCTTRDLAVDLRMKLGDWFRVVQLLKTGGGAGQYEDKTSRQSIFPLLPFLLSIMHAPALIEAYDVDIVVCPPT